MAVRADQRQLPDRLVEVTCDCPHTRLGGKQPVRVERQRRVVAGGGHAPIIGDGAEWGNLDPRWGGVRRPGSHFSLPPPGVRRHTVTMRTMARQLNARRTGSRGSATARVPRGCRRSWRCSAGCSPSSCRRARDERAAPPAAVKTTAATPREAEARGEAGSRCVEIEVTGVGAYDPEGDKSENGGDARLATDGIATTAWKSEHYRIDVPEVRRRARPRCGQAGARRRESS